MGAPKIEEGASYHRTSVENFDLCQYAKICSQMRLAPILALFHYESLCKFAIPPFVLEHTESKTFLLHGSLIDHVHVPRVVMVPWSVLLLRCYLKLSSMHLLVYRIPQDVSMRRRSHVR